MATKTRSTKASRAPSLAANAAAAHAAKVARLAAEGRAAIRAVRARAAQNSASYYDIGDSLRTLARNGVAEALGRADFAEVCALDLDMSLTHARRLMDITERLRRDIGETMSIRRAGALVALADATPDDDDAEGLLGATLSLPDGERLAVASASTESLLAAAAAIRAARGAPARGLTKTREERAAFKRLQSFVTANPALGIEKAALAARHGGAVVTLKLPLAKLREVARALAKKGALGD
jgi:hypothetical protein